jgi:hypothetical protein
MVTALPGATAASLLWRWHGRLHVTAVLKATFAFGTDGRAMTAVAPLPIVERDVPVGPGKPHLRACELAPLLSAVDVLVSGHVSAPPGAHEAGFEVWRGSARVLGKMVPLPPQGSVRMPLEPLGIGPLARSSSARAQLLGRLDPAALDREPLELPNDVDWSFFHAAPADQRLRRLYGDERVVLHHLHPSARRIEAALPRVSASARLMSGDTALAPIPLVADMLVVDVDRGVCSLIWRGHVAVDGADLRIVASVEEGAPPKAAVARTLVAKPGATMSLGDYFGNVVGAAAKAPPEPDELLATAEVAPAAMKQDATLEGAAKGQTLPFKPAPADAPPAARAPLVDADQPVGTGTLTDSGPARGRRAVAVTPFALATPRPVEPTAALPGVPPGAPKPARPVDPLLQTRWISPVEASRVRQEPTTPFAPGAANVPPPEAAERDVGTFTLTEMHGVVYPGSSAVPFESPAPRPAPAAPEPVFRGSPAAPPRQVAVASAPGPVAPPQRPEVLAPAAAFVAPLESAAEGPAGAFLRASPVSFWATDDLPGP